MKKIKIKCSKCGHTRVATPGCDDCLFLEYLSAPDYWHCLKGKTGTKLCKLFISKHLNNTKIN